MKMLLVAALVTLAPHFASAEEKECGVKGMHCDACKDMVKDRVCNDSYEVCDVTLKGKKGVLHLKTKDAAAKIDENALAKAMEDTTYKVEKCAAPKSKGKSVM